MWKNTNSWRLNNSLLNNEKVIEEIRKEKQKIPRNKWQWKHKDPESMGFSKTSSKREVCSNAIIPQETRKNFKKHKHMEIKQHVSK